MSPAKAGSGRDAAFSVFGLALPPFIYLLITYVLPPPLPIRAVDDLLDLSWQIIFTDGFLRAAQFGRDIVYTYGP